MRDRLTPKRGRKRTREDKETEWLLRRLHLNTVRLRLLALVVTTGTIANVTAVFLQVAQMLPRNTTVLSGIIATFGISCSLGWFESVRKAGNAYFEELSDSHEMQHTGMRMGIELRMHTHYSDLPLIPGRWGPLFYAIGNYVALFAGMLPDRF